MSWFEDLPEVLTRSDFASMLGREPRSIERMAARGLVAEPAYRNRGKCVWEEEAALGWFRTLHEHAVIVPATELAVQELATHHAYVCPLSSNHVGLARPRMLVMYRPGGQGLVFNVDAVETVNQQIDGTRGPTAETRKIMRDEEPLDAWQRPWTVFYLSEAGTIGEIAPSVQQGRYLRLGDVLEALITNHLSVPTLDEAFPTRK
ncbi:hypothetical protein ACIQOF_37700 [Streptomyces sp. NPDC091265]|uniref:hypothetical protein n=1 Tax=unclassified Streptomyces TaxID=2593676 RepID=UPI00344B25BF